MHYLVTYDANFNPTGGVVYYLTPPNGMVQTATDPLHAIIYCAFLMTFAVLFARIWVEIGGLSSRTVAKNLMNADVQVPGFRRAGLSIEQVLNRYIPPITVIGGLIIGWSRPSRTSSGSSGRAWACSSASTSSSSTTRCS